MSEQPEALRLAGALENLEATGWGGDCFALTESSEKQAEAAAAELRRLYALCDEMGQTVEMLLWLINRDAPQLSGKTIGYAEASLAKWKESR